MWPDLAATHHISNLQVKPLSWCINVSLSLRLSVHVPWCMSDLNEIDKLGGNKQLDCGQVEVRLAGVQVSGVKVSKIMGTLPPQSRCGSLPQGQVQRPWSEVQDHGRNVWIWLWNFLCSHFCDTCILLTVSSILTSLLCIWQESQLPIFPKWTYCSH